VLGCLLCLFGSVYRSVADCCWRGYELSAELPLAS
jgi:hypothetical protein